MGHSFCGGSFRIGPRGPGSLDTQRETPEGGDVDEFDLAGAEGNVKALVLEEVHDLGGRGRGGHDGGDLAGEGRVEREGADVRVDAQVLHDLLVDLSPFPYSFDTTPVASGGSILEGAFLGAEVGHGCCAQSGHNPNNAFYGDDEKCQWALQGYLKACGQQ